MGAQCSPADLPVSAAGERSLENVAGRPRLDSLSSVEEDDYDTLADIDYDKNVIRTKVRAVPMRCHAMLCCRHCPHPASPSSNTSAWLTWPARTSVCCGRNIRSTSGEQEVAGGLGMCPSSASPTAAGGWQ